MSVLYLGVLSNGDLASQTKQIKDADEKGSLNYVLFSLLFVNLSYKLSRIPIKSNCSHPQFRIHMKHVAYKQQIPAHKYVVPNKCK